MTSTAQNRCRTFTWALIAIALSLGSEGPTLACNWKHWFPCPTNDHKIQVAISGPSVVCAGDCSTWTISAIGYDMDHYHLYDKHNEYLGEGEEGDWIDPLGFSWSATGGTILGDQRTGTIQWVAPTTPGYCTIKCKANDIPYDYWDYLHLNPDRVWPPDQGSHNDPESEWFSHQVAVVGIAIDVRNPVLEVGQCRNFGSFVFAEVTPWPIDGLTFSWSAQAPLSVDPPDALTTYVTATSAGSTCSLTADLTAYAGSCHTTATLQVKKFGDFTLTGPTSLGYTHCTSTSACTFQSLGIQPPPGIPETTPLYGGVEKFEYQLKSSCPTPSSATLYEDVAAAPGCPTIPGLLTGSVPIPVGTDDDHPLIIWDSIGFFKMSCDDEQFVSVLSKVRQTVYVETSTVEGCILRRNCITLDRSAPDGTCTTYQQSVTITDGFDGCDCE